jgi:hypothetical protein
LKERIIFLTYLFISCSTEDKNQESIAVTETRLIKSISTKFISHQGDTQDKDMKTIAIANFLPTGELDKLTQHMTYPYNYEKPFEIKLWATPQQANVAVIMDGLTLDKAEYNFLYGNDWPKIYAQTAKKNHPQYPMLESSTQDVEVLITESELPSEIKLNDPYKTRHNQTYYRPCLPISFIEKFQYENGNVTGYTSFNETYDFKEFTIKKGKSGDSQLDPTFDYSKADVIKVNRSSTQFSYDGNKLWKTANKNIIYEFEYDQNRLSKAKYYNDGKLYNARIYYYTKNGLKDKTVILNVDSEPEYSIFYKYSFY